MLSISYWFYLGSIYLLILTWQDYKNNMMVDDRHNSFMLGLTISLYTHVYTTTLYKLALIIILGVLYKFMRKIKPLGEADLNTFAWVFLGYGLINPVYLGIFATAFSLLTLLYLFLKNVLLKYKDPLPFYAVILISWLLIGIILKIY